MAKLNRLTAKIFGETASTTNTPKEIGQFGSAKVGTYNATGDVATIQSLPAWSNGWIDAVTPTDQFPPLPEMTGVHKVLSYQNAYLLQQGIPEWDSATTYYENGFCAYNGIIYRSKIDENINNQPDITPGAWFDYGSGDYANQDISNLTTFGNARLQYTPFAINDGAVIGGNNHTLQSGSFINSYTEAGTYTIAITEAGNYEIEMYGGGGGNAHRYHTPPGAYYNLDTIATGGSGAGFKGVVNLPVGEYTLVVGKNGANGRHGTKGTSTGEAGGDTTFGNIISAGGGTGGYATGNDSSGSARAGQGGTLDITDSSIIVSTSLSSDGNNGTTGSAQNTPPVKNGGLSLYNGTTTGYGAGAGTRYASVGGFFKIRKLTGDASKLFCDPCTITTADGRTKVFDSAVTIDVSEELISSDIEFVQPIATNYYDGDIKKAFGEIGNNQTFAVGLSSNITIPAAANSLDKGFNNDTSNWFNLKLTTLANLANKGYYIIFSNPNPLKLSSISFSDRSGFVLTEGILEGSNDQQTWVELATISRTTSSNVETININSQGYYKYFRLIILRTGYSSDYIFYYDSSQITFNGVYRSSDGNYKIFKDYETGELVLSKQLIYCATEPQSPSDNDLWLDIATMPANLYEYNSTDNKWNLVNDLVYIGDCTVLGTGVDTLTNRYFNNGWNWNQTPHIVETYKNGDSWYRVYSDGWCVQGGTTANSTSKTIEVNFLKSFKNTSYNVQAIINTSYIGTWYQTQVTAKELNHMELANNNTTDRSIMWQACGYIF